MDSEKNCTMAHLVQCIDLCYYYTIIFLYRTYFISLSIAWSPQMTNNFGSSKLRYRLMGAPS